MQYWLIKSEPRTYSIEDLANEVRKTTYWEGIRNFQVRNMMRDQMRQGDRAVFYHSSCQPPGAVGIVEIVTPAYPDDDAFDPQSQYYDPKSTVDNPRWYRIDIKLLDKFPRMVTLHELKARHELADMALVKKGNRLSIMPVTAEQWAVIMAMAFDH
jgi:predicted RNA-binding protein with PUA-like domain